ncbi:hypothetical protein IAT38_004008 [Cryptococcus sp. DSM 104549]
MSHSPQTPLSRSLPPSRTASSPLHGLATRTPPPRTTPRRSQFATSSNLPGSIPSHPRHYNHPSTSNDMSSTFSSQSSFDDRNSGRRPLDAETFEWPIEGLAALKVFAEDTPLESGPSGGDVENLEDVPDVLLQGWMTRKGSFRLDLGRTMIPLQRPQSPVPDPPPPSAVYSNSISLYIGAYNPAPQECPFIAGIFVGITPLHSNVGQRYAETPYLWAYSTEHEFGGAGEYCPVELPLLSTLLQFDEVKEHDGFRLCIWVGSCWSIGPEFKLPDHMLSSTMRGLGRLLDRDTGDVRFVCLEHVVDPAQPGGTSEADEAVPGVGGLSLSDTTVTPSRPVIRSRKRVLYAHSDILEEKSGYFKDLLTSGFMESKRYTTVVVDDASFNTLYWVLRFVYTNELHFAPIGDVHLTMDQRRLDKAEIAKLLSAKSIDYLGPAEWAFHCLPNEGDTDDVESTLDQDSWAVKSVSSVGTSVSRRPVNSSWSPNSAGGGKDPATGRPRLGQPPSSGVRDKTARPASVAGTPTPTRTRISANDSSISTPTAPTSKPRHTPGPPSSSLASRTTSPNAAHTTSPQALALGSHYPLAKLQSEADPHVHPTERPSPASALEVYMLSDRYRLGVLRGLAKEHMMENMTCENCMPMVFASYNYDELHNEVLDFVVDHWAEVKLSPTFLRCIREVREDVWGESGPMVLHNIYMRL